ncbi:MAG: rRNA pseudouridine synthase [Oscillospiraceae bacterium]|nr:rRNA pseudouridine synthase [Oscillospiraceae bacterium]
MQPEPSYPRLQKYIAQCGISSRRHAEELILAGRVRVNGQVVDTLGSRVRPGDAVALDDRLIEPEARRIVILYHKPLGEVCTADDPQGRVTVLDRFKSLGLRVYPVGRLDYDSEGALLLTNDGALTERLLHPRHTVKKVYLARVEGLVDPAKLRALSVGVDIGDAVTAPADVRLIRQTDTESVLLFTIHEGRNRQIRRMAEAVGHRVLKLRRVQFGPVQLGNLARGEWRELDGGEIARLYDAAKPDGNCD